MSLKGMQPDKVVGSHLAFKPSAARIWFARVTQDPAPSALRKFAIDGFSPDGRKKLTRAAATHGCPRPLAPQGNPVFGSWKTVRGPIGSLAAAAPAEAAML